MTGAQIAALVFAILLLLPGGCFLVFGISLAGEHRYSDTGVVFLAIATGILAVAGLLFWLALRRRLPAPGPTP